MMRRENPFRLHTGTWWWLDEDEQQHGPYSNQMDALRALLKWCDTRSLWRKVWDIFR